MVEVNAKVEEPGENNVHNNAFYAEETLLKTELQAMRDCNPLTARHWIVRFRVFGVELLLCVACLAIVLFLVCLGCSISSAKKIYCL